MKIITVVGAILGLSIALSACKSSANTPPPPGSVGALGKSKNCRELRRRITLGQANFNGDRPWEQTTQLSELKNEYDNSDCE